MLAIVASRILQVQFCSMIALKENDCIEEKRDLHSVENNKMRGDYDIIRPFI